MSREKLREELSHFLKWIVVIVGIGNELRSDDGVGPALVARLKEKINAACIDVGLSPENYIGTIVKHKPDALLFIDAVDMDGPPATVKLIHADQIPEYGFSTHNMSPKLMIENIRGRTHAAIMMIGVQPRTIEFGEGISREVGAAMAMIEEVLVEVVGKK